jgi:hypothetical protein
VVSLHLSTSHGRGVWQSPSHGGNCWPHLAARLLPGRSRRAQQGRRERMRRIGGLMNEAATEANLRSYVAAFAQGLRQLGWI